VAELATVGSRPLAFMHRQLVGLAETAPAPATTGVKKPFRQEHNDLTAGLLALWKNSPESRTIDDKSEQCC
jgi:hypothetical protein